MEKRIEFIRKSTPAFYARFQSLDDRVDHTAGWVLDLFDLDQLDRIKARSNSLARREMHDRLRSRSLPTSRKHYCAKTDDKRIWGLFRRSSFTKATKSVQISELAEHPSCLFSTPARFICLIAFAPAKSRPSSQPGLAVALIR
jgi:hypothetical protein